MKLAMCYLHPGWLPHEFHESVLATQGLVHERASLKSGGDLHLKRNRLWRWFIEQSECDQLLWVDADMVFTAQDVKALQAYLDNVVQMVSAFAVRVNEDGSVEPAAVAIDSRGLTHKFSRPARGLTTVAGYGMAFVLFTREACEAIDTGPQWPFDDVVHEDFGLIEADIAMCLRARERGIQPWLAVDVNVGHVKTKVFR